MRTGLRLCNASEARRPAAGSTRRGFRAMEHWQSQGIATVADRPLTLDEARKTGRLRDFVRQQERWEKDNGYSGADSRELEKGLERLSKEPQPRGRTSRSRGGGD